MSAGPAAAPFDLDAYRAFVAGLELQRVDTLDVSASRSGDGEMQDAQAEVDSSFAIDSTQRAVFYKYDLTVRISGPGEVRLGEVKGTLVLVFRAASLDAPVEMVDHFGGTSAFMMAHPYLRELAASLAARIGFPGLALPLVRL